MDIKKKVHIVSILTFLKHFSVSHLGRAFEWKVKGHFLEKKGTLLWEKGTQDPLTTLKSQRFWNLKAF